MDENKVSQLTASEAVYGFMAWLICRTEVIKIGASENASPLPTLIKVFCDANGLADPTENYPNNLIHPKEIVYAQEGTLDGKPIAIGYQHTVFDDLRDECERLKKRAEDYRHIKSMGAVLIDNLILSAKDILGKKTDIEGAKILLHEMKEIQ